MIILAGQSHPKLAHELANSAQASVVEVQLSTFPNGEKRAHILHPEQLINQSVVIVQSFSLPVDEHIIETTLIMDAADRAGAKDITLVIPWFGYSLQDKMFVEGMPISARVIANILSAATSATIREVLLIDLHNPSVCGFFSVPTRMISALPAFADHFRTTQTNLHNTVVVAPDFGGLKRAREFADMLQVPLAKIDKVRDYQTGAVTVQTLGGESVTDRDCIVIDDIVNSGSTVAEVAEALKHAGARSVQFAATHGPLATQATEHLAHPAIDQVVLGNTVAQDGTLPSNATVISVVPLIAKELANLGLHDTPNNQPNN